MSITYDKMGYSIEIGYVNSDFWYLHLNILVDNYGNREIRAYVDWYGKRESTRFDGATTLIKDGFNWFGCQWKTPALWDFVSINSIEGFSRLVIKIMNAVYRDTHGYDRSKDNHYSFFGLDPRQLISSLEKRGVDRYYYDIRVGRYVPVSEMQPLYLSGWEAVGIGYSVVANDERDARNKLSIEMPASPVVLRGHLDRWFTDGRPVRDNGRVLAQIPGDAKELEWYVGEFPIGE